MGESETIGKVTLDLSKYGGQDLYCDGAVEDTILELVKQYPSEEYPRLIREQASWPVLYHLSDLRENIVDWLPLPENAKVLEVGAGCGAISGVLSKKAGRLDCVELSKKRSMINAYRHKDLDNITIHVGNFEDIEPELDRDYDAVFLIGVYEYAASYIHAEDPYDTFLRIIDRHRKPGGRIIIAIENRLGLKYYAGAREDHLGSYFTGLEDYPAGGVVRTFSRPALEKKLQAAGVGEYQFYYPYPDYKFMTTLYSDERLPREGELSANLLNFDRDRMYFFDEKKTYDSLIRDGLYPQFSNSFLVVIGPKSPVIYSKYSNDRAPRYAIRTDMVKDSAGLHVEKHPMQPQAGEHIKGILGAEIALRERFAGSNLKICPVKPLENGGVAFPFLTGETLESRLDHALQRQDMEEVGALLKQYRECMDYHTEAGVMDADSIFSNIFIGEDGSWQLIDYEWTDYEGADPQALCARALYIYLQADPRRGQADIQSMLKSLGLTQADMDSSRMKAREEAFQQRIVGERISLAKVCALIGNPILSLESMTKRTITDTARSRFKIYVDTGAGFNEKECYEQKVEVEDGVYNWVAFDIPAGAKNLRIDPAEGSCLFLIESLVLDGVKLTEREIKKCRANGKRMSPVCMAFAGTDPNLTLALKKPAARLEVYFRISLLDDKIARIMAGEK